MELNKIHLKSCLDGMTELNDDSIDLIMTSPPYPKGMRKYEKECSVEPQHYVTWIKPFLQGARRVLKTTGSMVLVLMDKIVDGEIHPYIDELKAECRKMGFGLVDDIIWAKCLSGSVYLYVKTPNFTGPLSLKDIAQLGHDNIKVWTGKRWAKIISLEKQKIKRKMLKLTLRSGETISCTPEHRFPTQRGLLHMSELVVGDIIEKTKLPEPEIVRDGRYFGLDAAWFAGLYLAEGSISGHTIQITGHAKEEAKWQRVCKIAKAYGGHATRTIKGNKMDIRVYGKMLFAIINTLLVGKTARGKNLAGCCWQYSDAFLRELLRSYLDRDGSWSDKNKRWRLGFTRNYELERDIRTLCARLNLRLKITRCFAKCNGKLFPSCQGEIRFYESNHVNKKQQNEILVIEEGVTGIVYDICIEDESHVFALASGVLTHNSNTLPNVDYTKRPIRTYEHCLWFAKNTKMYNFNGDMIRQPYAESTLKRYQPGNLETLHKRSGGQANQTWVGVKPNKKGAASGNVIYGARFCGRNPGHPAKYPDYLPEWFIKTLSYTGETILDPFTGSGTTLMVAKQTGRNYIGYEIGKGYYERAIQDLENTWHELEIGE